MCVDHVMLLEKYLRMGAIFENEGNYRLQTCTRFRGSGSVWVEISFAFELMSM